MLNDLMSYLRGYRHRQYIARLVEKGLKVGKGTTIMDGVFLDPAHCFLILIGSNCTIAPNVRLVAHDASMKRQLGITKVGKISIHDNCFIGDSAIILPGVSVGPSAVIGAGSVVTRDVPQGSVVAGNPARIVSRFDEFMKRHEERHHASERFSEERFNISRISAQDKQHMLAYLEKHVGYLEGKKP